MGPVATPVAAPPKPRVDVTRAPWHAFVAPICPKLLAPEARAPMAALASFKQALMAVVAGKGGAQERIGRVETLELALSGAFGPASSRPALLPAVILREALLKTGGSFHDALALADAAKDEITGVVFSDEKALLEHAARSVAPELRYLLHLHGVREECLSIRANRLAQAWYLLRHDRGNVGTRLVVDALRQADDISGSVQGGYLKAQLYRLQALAQAALALRAAGVKGDALTEIPPWVRLRIRIVSWIKRRFPRR